MENNTDRTRPKSAIEASSDHDSTPLSDSDQGLIILPAITPKEQNSTLKAKATTKSQKKPKKKQTRPKKQKIRTERKAIANSNQTKMPKGDHQSSTDFLPEYHSRTNGLRELLSVIDPNDLGAYPQSPPHKTSFEAQIEANLIESAMHLPHSRPGLPGSPDLPIGPTRWGLYLSGLLGTLAFLFVSALAYSHISSPTGIDWAKAKSGSTELWHDMSAAWSGEKPATKQPTQIAKISLPEPLHIDKAANETLIATSSRISTTAATAKKGTIRTPSANEIFISQQELEDQILALEANQASKRRALALKRPITEQNNPRHGKTTVNKAFTHGKSPDFDQLVVIPSTKIDPDMENRIFGRARSYLQQRDIASARMILQYAASLGSGLSAMALAETFDPNFAATINLPNVDSNRQDARKWYYMASRLGVKEAGARLTALK